MSDAADTKKAAAAIYAAQDELAGDIARKRYAALQPMFDRFGVEPEKLREYTHYELSYLANAIEEDNAGLFTQYVDWTKSMFSSYGIGMDVLAKNIDVVRAGLIAALPPECHAQIERFIRAAGEEVSGPSGEPSSFIDAGNPRAGLARDYLDAVLAGDRSRAAALVLDSFTAGLGIGDIYLNVLQPVQYEIGRLWQTNKITVAQEHFCSAVTQLIMSQLYYPHICSGEKKRGTFVALCVSGELHEIGMRMVADLFEMEGWNVVYLGANMPAYNVIDTLIDRKAQVLGISAAMASSVNRAAAVIQAVRQSPASSTRILVGGYGFNRDKNLWKLVGADHYASTGPDALRLAG